MRRHSVAPSPSPLAQPYPTTFGGIGGSVSARGAGHSLQSIRRSRVPVPRFQGGPPVTVTFLCLAQIANISKTSLESPCTFQVMVPSLLSVISLSFTGVPLQPLIPFRFATLIALLRRLATDDGLWPGPGVPHVVCVSINVYCGMRFSVSSLSVFKLTCDLTMIKGRCTNS